MSIRNILGYAALALVCAAGTASGATTSAVADAAAKGDRAAVRTLIQQKADVNAAQTDGATALHWAVYREDAEIVDMLIRAGANVKVANREGEGGLDTLQGLTRADRELAEDTFRVECWRSFADYVYTFLAEAARGAAAGGGRS